MLVPVVKIVQGVRELIQVIEASSFQSQGAQLLPPRLDQVQPAGIFGDELDLHFGPSRQSQFGLLADVDRQVVFDDQPAFGRKGSHDHLQQMTDHPTLPR